MIKNLLLDLDDTIFDFHLAEKIALSKTLSSFGVNPTQKIVSRYSEINASLWKRLELGELSREEVLVNRFSILFSELGISLDAVAARVRYEKNLSEGHYFINGAEELLEKLSGNVRLYLASNGTAAVQNPRIASSGIEKYFDGIFISENVGFNKPDKRFFEAIFKTVPEFSHDETLIVGDSISSDIKGGKNAGIKTCLFNPEKKKISADVIPDFEISSLSELLTLIKTL